MRALSVLLFLTVCAYAGAKLWDELVPSRQTAQVQRVTVTESVSLQGVALRDEQPVRAMGETGVRLPAGAVLDGGDVLPCPALYVSGGDGLEKLSPETLDSLSVETVSALLDTAESAQAQGGGRLIFGFAWYFAAISETETALAPGDRCRVRFDGQERFVGASAVSVNTAQDGRQVILLRLTESGEFYQNMRKSGAELLLSQYEALSLPTAAVGEEAGQCFVFALTASGQTERREIQLLSCGGETSLAATGGTLREGDTVLLSGG